MPGRVGDGGARLEGPRAAEGDAEEGASWQEEEEERARQGACKVGREVDRH